MSRSSFYLLLLANIVVSIATVFGVASLAYAMDVQVTGAGFSDVDGCYVDGGSGVFTQEAGNFDIEYYTGPYVHLIPISGYTTDQYYANTSGSTLSSALAAVTWVADWVSLGGGAPAPTVTETTCSGGGGGGASSTPGVATSSIDQTQENYNTAFFLYAAGAFFGLYIFKKR